MFSNDANNLGGLTFSEAELRRALTSSEGRQLLSLLRRDGGGALQQAAQAFKNGKLDEAKAALEPMLQNDEAAKLLDQLKKQPE